MSCPEVIRTAALVLLALLVATTGCRGRGAPAHTPEPSDVARALELDHIYIWVRPGAPEVSALRAAGLEVGDEPHPHTGDGTSSRLSTFENFHLELQYLDAEVSSSSLSEAERAFNLLRSHWRETGASPFGVGFRRPTGAPEALPLRTEALFQPWMSAGSEIRQITALSETLTPDLFVVPREMALTGWIDEMRKDPDGAALLDHPLGVRRLTAARLVVAADGLTTTTKLLSVQIEAGASPLVELTFDDGQEVEDLRPELPLLVRYARRP